MVSTQPFSSSLTSVILATLFNFDTYIDDSISQLWSRLKWVDSGVVKEVKYKGSLFINIIEMLYGGASLREPIFQHFHIGPWYKLHCGK